MSPLVELWPLISLLVYAASAAVGIGYSAANLLNARGALSGLDARDGDGGAREAARGMSRVNLYLLGGQALQLVLVGITIVVPSSGGGSPSARGVVFAAILIAMNLLLSLSSVASAHTWRRVRAHVVKLE